MRKRDDGFLRDSPISKAFARAGISFIGPDNYCLLHCPLCREGHKKPAFLMAVVNPSSPHAATIREALAPLGVPMLAFDCDEETKLALLAPEFPELLSVKELAKQEAWKELALRKSFTIEGEQLDVFEAQTRIMDVYEQHYRTVHKADLGWIHELAHDRGYFAPPISGPGQGAGAGDAGRWSFELWRRKVDSRRLSAASFMAVLRAGRLALLLEPFAPKDEKQTDLIQALADCMGIEWCAAQLDSYDDDGEETTYVTVTGSKKKRTVDEFAQIVAKKYPAVTQP